MTDDTQFPTLGFTNSSPDLPPPGEIGDFRILSVLGRGGMGVVYEAEQTDPERRVALKVIRGGKLVDDLQLRLFRREAQTLARLIHPNIAALYEAGRTDDGQHFFTMELVRGRPLDEYVRERMGDVRPPPRSCATGCGSSRRSAARSPTRTSEASSIGTSSPRTSSSSPTTSRRVRRAARVRPSRRSRSSTSVSRASRTTTDPRRGRS
jgi:hypothetical protein